MNCVTMVCCIYLSCDVIRPIPHSNPTNKKKSWCSYFSSETIRYLPTASTVLAEISWLLLSQNWELTKNEAFRLCGKCTEACWINHCMRGVPQGDKK